MQIVDCNTHFGRHADRDTDVSLATLLSELGRHRIARAWTYSQRGSVLLSDDANRETLAASHRHRMLVPIATIDPKRRLGEESEVQHCLHSGVRIFRFFPRKQGWHLDSRPFHTLLDRLRGSGAVLMFSADSWGSATAVARATAESGLPVVLVDVHYTQMAECIDVLQRWSHVYAATNRLATVGAIEILVREVGAHRLLFGSEAPERPLQCALNQIWFADISDEDRAAIFAGTAARVLGEHAPASADVLPPIHGAGEPRPEPPPRSSVAIIDVHAHVGRFPFPIDDDRAVEQMAARREKHNIARITVSSSDAIYYDLVDGNHRAHELISRHEWLLGYVVTNPRHLTESVAEMDRYYRFDNFVGAKIHGEHSRTPTDSPRIRALIAEIARRGRPVLIHNAGANWDTALVRLAREFSDLKIIIAHAGLGAPSLEAIEAAAAVDNLYLEFCSSEPTRGIIRQAIERVGVEKILYGSDQLLLDPAYVLGAYQDAALSPQEWQQIAWQNPCRVFGLT